MKPSYFPLAVLFIAIPGLAAEPLSYIAEHIIEVPMDFRYLAFPQTPVDTKEAEWRVQAGYGSLSGGLIDNSVPMLGLQYYRPFADDNGFIFSLFYDQLKLSGSKGVATAQPTLDDSSALPAQFLVQVKRIDGKGSHYGATAAYVARFENDSRLHLGLAFEQLDISRFDIEFSTLDLTSNFDGKFDYSGTYNAFTAYASYERATDKFGSDWVGTARIIGALPLPRVGFRETFTSPTISETSQEGKHIPDAYVGVSYSFEHLPSSWRVDVGSAIYSYLVEPVGHRDVESSFSIVITKAW